MIFTKHIIRIHFVTLVRFMVFKPFLYACNMQIIELLKNVVSRHNSDHRFGISAINLVNYIEIAPLFKALLNIIQLFLNSLFMDI